MMNTNRNTRGLEKFKLKHSIVSPLKYYRTLKRKGNRVAPDIYDPYASSRETFLANESMMSTCGSTHSYCKTECDWTTGSHNLDTSDENSTLADTKQKRYVIRGYTGYIPQSFDVCGTPVIQSEDTQHGLAPVCKYKVSIDDGHSSPGKYSRPEQEKYVQSGYSDTGKMLSRYKAAIEHVHSRNLTQEALLHLVQSKLSERVNSYAQQHVRLRKIFDYFDFNDDSILDEYEFKKFLELSNIYFDDYQALALFAYFDHDRTGGIEWDRFAQLAMVPNPSGGTAVQPKSITNLNYSN